MAQFSMEIMRLTGSVLCGKGSVPRENQQHDLGERARVASEAGLVLRKRTLAHLATLSASNEYHVISYAPELTSTLSQVNRVMATVDELSRKVRKMLRASS